MTAIVLTNPANPLIIDYAFAPPVIRRDLGQIWWVRKNARFHAAKFREGVWPYPGDDPCPGERDDGHAEQYDPGYRDRRARKAKVAPTGS